MEIYFNCGRAFQSAVRKDMETGRGLSREEIRMERRKRPGG
jgi:hypothetical protein